MVSVTCTSCQAVFEVDLAPGAEFACGDCGATLKVKSLQVLKPVKHGVVAPKKPEPVSPAPPPKPKVIMPLKPAAPADSAASVPAETLTTAPSPAPKVIQPTRPPAQARSESGSSAPPKREPRSPGRTPRPAAAPKKNSKAVVYGLSASGLVLVIALVVMITSSGKDSQETNTKKPAPPPAVTPSAPTLSAEDQKYNEAKERAKSERTVPALTAFAELAWTRSEAAEAKGQKEEGQRFKGEALGAYRGVVALDSAHKVAHERLGDVYFDAESLQKVMKEPWMTNELRTDIELGLDELAQAFPASRKGSVWLAKDAPATTAWQKIASLVEGKKKSEEDRKSDPFYPDAEKMGQSLVREFSAVTTRIDFHLKGVEGDAFKVFTFKPYVLLVQRTSVGDEADIAARWSTNLEDLRRTFYEKLGDEVGMEPMNRPTPVLILRNNGEYSKYIRRDDSPDSSARRVTSGAHFEPWTNRLVCYLENPERERVVLFHEGTHQIVEFAMKTVGTRKGLMQSLWFSEGLADFFGGHGKNWDAKQGRYIYEPGLINSERLTEVIKGKQSGGLFPLEELLDYSRLDYSKDEQDPTKSNRVLNGYCQGWALCYFLAVWQDGKYRHEFLDYVKGEFAGRTGKSAFQRAFANYGLDVIEQEFLDMIEELRIANQEKRIVDGKVLPKK